MYVCISPPFKNLQYLLNVVAIGNVVVFSCVLHRYVHLCTNVMYLCPK
jgi:hypothetical protein